MDKVLNLQLGHETFTTMYHNKKVRVSGEIGDVKPVTPELVTATFKCEHCGKIINIKQGGGKTKLLKPESCTNNICDHKNLRFKFLQEKSTFSDYQEIWLKPIIEDIKLRVGKGQKVILKQNLVGAQEGENIQITGTLGFELKGRTNFAIPIIIASNIKRLE